MSATLVVSQELKIPILAGDTWDSYVVLDAAKGKDVNVYVTAFYHKGGAPAFDSGFNSWINSNAAAKTLVGSTDWFATVSAMGYDAYHTALEALKKAGSTDPAKVLSVLGSVKYSGVTGSGTFDSQGDAVRNSAFIKKCNTKTGEWEFTKQQKVD
ncbi:MAG: hypothetical protein FWG42_07245 [Clostridiales bacterium]|nr:hypothetical protein [Clostridiales bacterium]